MSQIFRGTISLNAALAEQKRAVDAILAQRSRGLLLGFECEPVITLGARANPDDLMATYFPVMRTDRGGQATIHHLGQLVIFPVWPVKAIGVRRWVEGLAAITSRCLALWGIESHWDARSPGLYTPRGKIMACGIRLHKGISTHGIAINVRNNLADFAQIRACGIQNAPMDRMGGEVALEEIFQRWTDFFYDHFAVESDPGVDKVNILAEI